MGVKMQDKIIFLGTAGESLVYSNQICASGGIILHIDGMQFVLDPGPGTLTKAAEYGVNLRDTTAVFVSHNHINHCNDVNAAITAMTYNGLDKKGVLISNKSCYNGNDDSLPYITKHSKKLVEKSIILTSGQKLAIGNIELLALATKQKDPTTIGLRLFGPKFNIVYSSDTAYFRELGEDYKNCDILILNVTYPFGIKGKALLSCEEAIKVINKAKPKLVILTHFGIKMLKADPLYEAREIQKATGIQVIAAKDGMAINPISYSTSSRQKTLNMYK